MNTIRNIAVCGHGGTGKTTLVEQLLFRAGVIDQFEKVESGRTSSDYTDEEIEHKISLHTSLLTLPWQGTKINILDSPGSADFVGEVISAFRVCETALMLVDAVAGVQIETVKLWRRLDNRNLPRILFFNKMDQGRADLARTLAGVQEAFKSTAVPLCLPLGQAEAHEGVIDLLKMKAVGPGGKEFDIPADREEEAAGWREKLIETAAEGDDELTEKFFDQGTLEGPDIIRGLRKDLAANSFVPVLCGSAETGIGVDSLLNVLAEICPAPGRMEEPLEDGTSLSYESQGDFRGFVFKTSIDKFSGKISYIKVVRGSLGPTEIFNVREEKKERISKVFTVNGKNLKEIPSLETGDLGAVTKTNSIETNDSLSLSSPCVSFKPLALPHPVHSLAIRAENQKDEDKMNDLLHKVAEQDLTFTIGFDEETKETVIRGMGELHINTILEKLEKEFKIKVATRRPKVPYRETITKSTEVEYTHKKQTGGHGQYGKVCIRVSPLPRGEQFTLENVIRGGSISRGYIPGIEKGLKEAMSEGHLADYPMVDVAVSLFDGKEHSVDSSEMAFKLAAKQALKNAFENCGPTLLEPIMNLVVFVEDQYLGDVLSDLSGKRGRVQDQSPIGGGIQSIKAQVPQGELMNYAIDLKSITSGTGAFEMDLSSYEPVSGKIAQDIIKSGKARE